ncbi:uncharacterized protein METZ01_LOCUS57284, partial [marine metagenome]
MFVPIVAGCLVPLVSPPNSLSFVDESVNALSH